MTTGLRFYPAAHRYRLDGVFVPSVTGISKLSNTGCEGLIKWSGELAAGYAHDHRELVEQLEREAYVDLVGTESRREGRRATVRGTDVHALAQGLLSDEPVQVPDDLVPYVRQVVTLIERFDLMPLLTEALVGNRTHSYAGRLDVIARLVTAERGEHVGLIDWKTGKSFWTDTAVQLAGYRGAEFAVVEDIEQPMPDVEACYVAHIGPDYAELYPVEVGREAWLAFLNARGLYPFTKVRRDSVIGDPCEHPPVLLEGTGAALL